MKKVICLFCVLFFLISCFNETILDNSDSISTTPNGDCSNSTILSKERLSFNTQGGVDNIVILDDSWWLDGGGEGCELIGAENDPNYCDNNYCRNNGNVSSNLVMRIECPWFSVTQTDEYTLFVSVSPNETGKERKESIVIQSGNCFSGILVSQSAE